MLNHFGPKRFIYGSDFPIFRMKARRVVEHGFYINEIPYPEAERITFFIYEEITSCKKVAEKLGLAKEDINQIFYENSARIFQVKK